MRRLFLAVLLAFPLYAHEGLHEQIEETTHAIERDPRNAALYLKRAELYRVHHEFAEAARDYEQARLLDADLHAVELGRGQLLLDTGRAREAVPVLQHYVKLAPRDGAGHVALARAWMNIGRPKDAVASFEKALTPRPEPEIALEYAAALVAAGRRDDALQYLDQREPLVTYRLAAIDLELRAGNLASALRRVETIEATAARKDEWMERRGDILMKMGRVGEARAAYRAALDAIEKLPPERRRTRATMAMEQRLRAELGFGVR